ncbi:Unknown protein, partial [Striga hermonthica]
EDASDWWIDHWARRLEAELHALTWEQMKVMVRNKFLPQSFWDRMEHEFYHLQQGSSTVDEYIRTFTRMCLFAGDAVNTDAKKARKFLKGLNQRIRELVGSHGPMSFADTVSRAQEVESCFIPIAPVPLYYHSLLRPLFISSVSPGSISGKRKSDYQNKKKGKKGSFGRRDDRPTQGQHPRCPKCGRFHTRECLADQRACYNCNRPGHYASVCPEPKRQQHQPPFAQQQGWGQARVYTITHDEAARNAGTMFGMLSISHVPVFALCDTGATHSFISSRCLEVLSIGTVHACDPLEVSLASGKIIISDSVVRNLPICIGGRVLEADVYVIDMLDFDMILGMDWLTRYRADI